MKSLESQYKNITQTEINIEWNNAAKYNNFPKIKYMLETDYININDSNIETLLFRCSYNDNIKIFKYVLKHYQLNNKTLSEDQWKIVLNSACISDGDQVLKFAMKKHQFSTEQLSTQFVETIKNIPAFELLATQLDVCKEVEKNNFLEKVVSSQAVEMVKLLINKYQIDFTSFKDLAIKNVSYYNGDKVLELIETQSLFTSLSSDLVNEKKIKSLKI